MPKPGPFAAALFTFTGIALDAGPAEATLLIAQICLAEGWCDDLATAQEKAEQWAEGYLVYLRRELDAAAQQSRPIRFAINSSSEYLIQGACFIEPNDPPDIQAAKRNRLYYLHHLEWLRGLSPEAFECVCRGVITMMGAIDARMTPRSGDQGIDFYGKLQLRDRLGGSYVLGGVDQKLSVWLIGQAKHYASIRVATPDLRELVGSVELARTRSFAGSGMGLEELQILACDPVFYLFFTTGEISRDGWDLIYKTGMIGLNGEMIAAFLADNSIGLSGGDFSVEALNTWAGQFDRR
jgi:hypothetical protein